MNVRLLIGSFGYAVRGIVYTLRTQQNMRIHLVVAVIAVTLLVTIRPPLWQVAWIVASVFGVMAGEAFNTALEAAVDRIGTERHPLAAAAKDAAAGGVLLLVLHALVAGAIVFGQPLLGWWTKFGA